MNLLLEDAELLYVHYTELYSDIIENGNNREVAVLMDKISNAYLLERDVCRLINKNSNYYCEKFYLLEKGGLMNAKRNFVAAMEHCRDEVDGLPYEAMRYYEKLKKKFLDFIDQVYKGEMLKNIPRNEYNRAILSLKYQLENDTELNSGKFKINEDIVESINKDSTSLEMMARDFLNEINQKLDRLSLGQEVIYNDFNLILEKIVRTLRGGTPHQ